jgi:3-phenylpropionate/trans-cinnamate dioxygenase ferredoxin reductase component
MDIDDGIVVDRSCRTSAEGVWAAGDAVRMLVDWAPTDVAGRGVRLETFTDAQRQGEVAAASMLGDDATCSEAPYTWSDQFDVSVNSIGLAPAYAESITVAGPEVVVVLSVVGPRLHAVSVVGPASGTGRLVALARHLVTRRADVDVVAVRSAKDLPGLTRTLRAALTGMAP